MFDIQLPIWANKGQLNRLKQLALIWFTQVKNRLMVAISTDKNALTTDLFIVDLLAFERNIERFPTEPESLYRKRVYYAFINAKEAGTRDGLSRIFNRLGIGEVSIFENNPLYDWDVITISLSDDQLAENQPLLKVLLETYGRTCRRYVFESVSTIPITLATGSFNQSYSVSTCPTIEL